MISALGLGWLRFSGFGKPLDPKEALARGSFGRKAVPGLYVVSCWEDLHLKRKGGAVL